MTENPPPQSRPAEPRPTVTKRLAAWWAVATVAAVGVLAFLILRPSSAGVVLGIACLLAAALRSVLPTQWAGGLVVRTRTPDTILYAVLGAVMIAISLALRSRG